MKTKLFLLCLLALGLVAGDAQAQSQDRAGTAGATYLLVPTTARTAALSVPITGGLSDLNPIEALASNPAGIVGSTSETSALFSRMEYVADIGINYFGVARKFGNNSIALTVNAWDFGDISLQTEDSPELSDLTFDASNVIVGVSLGRQFTDRIAAGVTVKGLVESVDDVSANGLAFDAGMTYIAGESGLRFGVALKNFGPKMQYDGTGLVRFAPLPEQRPGAKANAVNIDAAAFELPSQLSVGFSYQRPFSEAASATLFGSFTSNSFSQDLISGGLEVGVLDLVYVRGGYSFQEDRDATFYEGWNLGAGLNLNVGGRGITADYAYRPVEFFEAVNMFTVGVGL
ncbi:MAG: PorV/PorQ family protein [Bacteroidota bacterium]